MSNLLYRMSYSENDKIFNITNKNTIFIPSSILYF